MSKTAAKMLAVSPPKTDAATATRRREVRERRGLDSMLATVREPVSQNTALP